MLECLYDKSKFKAQSPDFRIGAVISDGQWYDLIKWRKQAKVKEDELKKWVADNLATGFLLKNDKGSYRLDLAGIKKWYADNNIELGMQLVDFTYPPRYWRNHVLSSISNIPEIIEMTETDGFLNAPSREIGIVTFEAEPYIALRIQEKLRGVGVVREEEPGKYKLRSLSANYGKLIIKEVFDELEEEIKNNKLKVSGEESPATMYNKIHVRTRAARRELIDFNEEFTTGLIQFYKQYSKPIIKTNQETIQIYIPDPLDQETQVVMWIIQAIEKFDESTGVPFAAYLDNVLRRWPHNLSYDHLKKDLSVFQREKARILNILKKDLSPEIFKNVSDEKLAEMMNMSVEKFRELNEKHQIWARLQTAESLTHAEGGEEKEGDHYFNGRSSSDVETLYNLSRAGILAAIESEDYASGLKFFTLLDLEELNQSILQSLSKEFVLSLGVQMQFFIKHSTNENSIKEPSINEQDINKYSSRKVANSTGTLDF